MIILNRKPDLRERFEEYLNSRGVENTSEREFYLKIDKSLTEIVDLIAEFSSSKNESYVIKYHDKDTLSYYTPDGHYDFEDQGLDRIELMCYVGKEPELILGRDYREHSADYFDSLLRDKYSNWFEVSYN